MTFGKLFSIYLNINIQQSSKQVGHSMMFGRQPMLGDVTAPPAHQPPYAQVDKWINDSEKMKSITYFRMKTDRLVRAQFLSFL